MIACAVLALLGPHDNGDALLILCSAWWAYVWAKEADVA
jgi:hypothetical protein